MAHSWIPSVRSGGQLTIYMASSIAGTAWENVFRQGVNDFNVLARGHNLGVSFVWSEDAPTDSGGGAAVKVESADGPITFTYAGTEFSRTLSGSQMHGATFQIRRDAGIEKAFIYVPTQPLINTPRGQRPVGDGVKKVIAVHELVHAGGLENSDHTQDDVFQGTPQVDYGQSPARDRVPIGRGRFMPPIVMGATTIQRIRQNWT
jgi:hypothetical protein